MDLLDLTAAQVELRSVDEPLDGGKLVYQNQIRVVSFQVEAGECIVQELFVQVNLTLVGQSDVQNGAHNLEQVVGNANVIAVGATAGIELLNEQILLGVLHELVQRLPSPSLHWDQEVHALQDIHQVNVSTLVPEKVDDVKELLLDLVQLLLIHFLLFLCLRDGLVLLSHNLARFLGWRSYSSLMFIVACLHWLVRMLARGPDSSRI